MIRVAPQFTSQYLAMTCSNDEIFLFSHPHKTNQADLMHHIFVKKAAEPFCPDDSQTLIDHQPLKVLYM